jgi:hypothetical protein
MTINQPLHNFAINSREDLAYAVDIIDGALQSINDYFKKHPKTNARIRFPHGQLRTVSQHLEKFDWIKSDVLANNLANQLVFLDLLTWILNRTDLMGTARTMLYKNIVVVCGAVAEALLDSAANEVGIEADTYRHRLRELKRKRVIYTAMHDDLSWLWILRGKIHLHIHDDVEQDIFKVTEARRAVRVVSGLVSRLKSIFSDKA